jgi:hypothetical protein
MKTIGNVAAALFLCLFAIEAGAATRPASLWRVAEPSPVSSQQYPYFATTTAASSVPYIAYAKVPLDGERIQWRQASTVNDPSGLPELSGPAMVYLNAANGTPGNLQVFVTGANDRILEKHQTRQVWRTWGRVAPTLPSSAMATIASAPAAVAPRSMMDGSYKKPVVAITDNRGRVWAIVSSLSATDDSNQWGPWRPLETGDGHVALTFTSAPSLWADSFGSVHVVCVAGDRAFETRFDPATGRSDLWVELPGNGRFASGVAASFRTDFETAHIVDYAGLGTDKRPYVASLSLIDGIYSGWIRQPLLPNGVTRDSAPAVGTDYDFERGFRPFVTVRTFESGRSEWYWRSIADLSDHISAWRKMVR